jgi:hypothetical protein
LDGQLGRPATFHLGLKLVPGVWSQLSNTD